MLPPDLCQGNSGYAFFTTSSDMFMLFVVIIMIKRLPNLLILCLLALLVWFLWQKPAVSPEQPIVRIALPHAERSATAEATLWRVVTRRLVSHASVNTLSYRLQQMGLTPMEIRSQEEVTLHAFDDARQYNSWQDASAASEQWKAKGVDVNVIKVDDSLYMLGLGRLYQEKYALLLQQKLRQTGMLYRYQRRTVSVPTWRFTFAATDRGRAETLWKQLEDTGVMMPVLMPESRFQIQYSKAAEQE